MTQKLAEKVYETLRERIIRGDLRPASPLDTHRIASDLQMSVTPVRDAIKKLEAEGYLEVIPRSGTFVRHFTLEDLIRGYELVEALDGMAGFLVAERVREGAIDPEDLSTRLSALADEMDAHLEQDHVRRWAEADERFHATVFEAAGNALILNSYSTARSQMRSVLSFISPIHVDRANSVREHRQIIAALQAGDRLKARDLCHSHRHQVRRILKQLAEQM